MKRGIFRGMFTDFRRMIDDFEAEFGDLDAAFEDLEDKGDAADPPKTGETVTTRREETRSDGTRVVTTITRSRR